MRNGFDWEKAGRNTARGVLGLAVLIALADVADARQTTPTGIPPVGVQPTPPSTTMGPGRADTDPFVRARSEGAQRSIATDRQKRLLADADKLVELSNELKIEVDKSTKNDLSLTVVKKAAEIEKLAHDLKEREKN